MTAKPDQPTDSPAQALPVTFRPARTRAVLLTAGAAVFAALVVISVLLPNLSPGERTSFVFTGALLLGVLVLLSRPKVVADETGVTVVNIATSRRLEWAEIVRVNLRPGDPWVFLDLTDGTSLPALGIQPGIAKQRAISDARALRALVDARSGREADGSAGADGNSGNTDAD